jgi:hypothetical protein
MGAAGNRRFTDVFQLDRLADRHAGAYERAVAHAQVRRR